MNEIYLYLYERLICICMKDWSVFVCPVTRAVRLVSWVLITGCFSLGTTLAHFLACPSALLCDVLRLPQLLGLDLFLFDFRFVFMYAIVPYLVAFKDISDIFSSICCSILDSCTSLDTYILSWKAVLLISLCYISPSPPIFLRFWLLR